jgi:hypothetical protein
MMGCRTGSQDRLFYSFNLDEHILQNHLLRGIERCLDLGELRQHLAAFLDFPRFCRHLLRSKLNWRVSHEESEIHSRIQI